MEKSNVSVVIPTIGRESLFDSVLSVILQTYPPLEIIIIGTDFEDLHELFGNEVFNIKMKYVHEDYLNVSRRRNIGINCASGYFVAFLDDDDFWLETKLEIQMKYCEFDVISCRAEYFGWRNQIKPNKILKNDLLVNIFSGGIFSQLDYGVPTPTLMVKRSIAKEVLFDEDMSEWEDLWFIHQLEQLNATFIQLPDVLVRISSTKPLQNRVPELYKFRDWFYKLNSIRNFLGLRFVLKVGVRNLIFRRHFSKGCKLLCRAIIWHVKSRKRVVQ